jgi:hypothetical protein
MSGEARRLLLSLQRKRGRERESEQSSVSEYLAATYPGAEPAENSTGASERLAAPSTPATGKRTGGRFLAQQTASDDDG